MTPEEIKEQREWLDKLAGYTPGPWQDGKSNRFIVATEPTGYEDELSLKAYGGHLVCESVFWSTNARLIAAAPDLRDRYAAALDEIERLRGIVSDMNVTEVIADALIEGAIADKWAWVFQDIYNEQIAALIGADQ